MLWDLLRARAVLKLGQFPRLDKIPHIKQNNNLEFRHRFILKLRGDFPKPRILVYASKKNCKIPKCHKNV